jgi:hypothetical protein
MASIDEEVDFIPSEEPSVKPLSEEDLAVLSQNEDKNDDALDTIRHTDSHGDRERLREERSTRIASERIVYVTIGRMNPPTTGHKSLIKTMIKQALLDGLTQINIILSSTVDSEKNILEDETKRRCLYEMIEHSIESEVSPELSIYSEVMTELREEYPDRIREFRELMNDFWVEIVCMKDPTHEEHGKNPITKSLKYILGLYNNKGVNPRNIRLVVGEDRTVNDDFGWLGGCFPGDRFETISMPRLKGAMSATYIRGLIASGEKHQYMEAMAPTGLSESSLEDIYKEISKYLAPSGGRRVKNPNRRSKKRRAFKKRKTCKKRYKSKKSRYYIHGRKKTG